MIEKAIKAATTRGEGMLQRIDAERERVKMWRVQVRFCEAPTQVLWDNVFVDEVSGQIAVRTEFPDGPGSVVFDLDDRGELCRIFGKNVVSVGISPKISQPADEVGPKL